jgi:hypothetical protein
MNLRKYYESGLLVMLIGLICLYLTSKISSEAGGFVTLRETLFFLGFALLLAGLVVLGWPGYRRRTKQPAEGSVQGKTEKPAATKKNPKNDPELRTEIAHLDAFA